MGGKRIVSQGLLDFFDYGREVSVEEFSLANASFVAKWFVNDP